MMPKLMLLMFMGVLMMVEKLNANVHILCTRSSIVHAGVINIPQEIGGIVWRTPPVRQSAGSWRAVTLVKNSWSHTHAVIFPSMVIIHITRIHSYYAVSVTTKRTGASADLNPSHRSWGCFSRRLHHTGVVRTHFHFKSQTWCMCSQCESVSYAF